jgi:hypothetical protein
MINNMLFLAYEIWFYLLLITIIKILLLYISWVSPYTTKQIKICGGPRDSGKIRRSSWSAKVCPGLLYAIDYLILIDLLNPINTWLQAEIMQLCTDWWIQSNPPVAFFSILQGWHNATREPHVTRTSLSLVRTNINVRVLRIKHFISLI